jgi:hypothetical protein
LSKPIFPDIPDFYTDRMRLTVTVFGVNVTFGLSAPHPEETGAGNLLDVLEVVRVRMSLEHAKVMGMLLKKQIKIYEAGTKTQIAIPLEVINSLELGNEQW